MAQFVQDHTRRVKPEPDQQPSLAKETITNLVHTPTQTLACETQEREEKKDGGDNEPGTIYGQLLC